MKYHTEFVVTEQPLNLTNEPLERETPPGSNGAKKAQEMRNMHGHMHIGARFNIGMYEDEIMYILSHILKVSCRATCCHYPHAGK